MKHYAKYLKTVSRHKWFVLLECIKMARETNTPMLIIRGLMHDMSKFRPSEFFPYADYFNGDRKSKPAYYKPYDTGDAAFDKAWLLHQKRNTHHWQWHILPLDDGGTKIFEMPVLDRMEMLCDWRGAGRAYGNVGSTLEWYTNNKGNMVLHANTRSWIENELGYVAPEMKVGGFALVTCPECNSLYRTDLGHNCRKVN